MASVSRGNLNDMVPVVEDTLEGLGEHDVPGTDVPVQETVRVRNLDNCDVVNKQRL